MSVTHGWFAAVFKVPLARVGGNADVRLQVQTRTSMSRGFLAQDHPGLRLSPGGQAGPGRWIAHFDAQGQAVNDTSDGHSPSSRRGGAVIRSGRKAKVKV